VGALSFCAIFASLHHSGLRMVNIPMFFCLRKLVTTFVLVYEWMAFGKTQDRWTATSVLGISVGTVLAGWDTLNDEVLGYLITMLNNVRNFGVHACYG
jgi:drug/metabolite transporter (DMT)-like permease